MPAGFVLQIWNEDHQKTDNKSESSSNTNNQSKEG
jgi:hypothetical protein